MSEPIELAEFLKWQPEPLVPIISHGILYEQSKALVYGKSGSLKTMLMGDLALALRNGDSWLDFNTIPSSVLYLQLEVAEQLLQKRIKIMTKTRIGSGGNNGHTPERLWFWSDKSVRIDRGSGLDTIIEWVEKLKPRVLIIDPIYKIVSGDLLAANSIQRVTDVLDELIDKYKLSIILVHHAKKGASEEWGGESMLGSGVWNFWAETIIEIKRIAYDQLQVSFEKVRNQEEELHAKYIDIDFSKLQFNLSSRRI